MKKSKPTVGTATADKVPLEAQVEDFIIVSRWTKIYMIDESWN